MDLFAFTKPPPAISSFSQHRPIWDRMKINVCPAKCLDRHRIHSNSSPSKRSRKYSNSFHTSCDAGVIHPRPSCPRDFRDHALGFPIIRSLPENASIPKLIVFDLDNTLWTPELFTLRHVKGYSSASSPGPVPGKDVWLLDGALQILQEIVLCDEWKRAGTLFAVASRTNKGPWARALLGSFKVPETKGHDFQQVSLDNVLTFQEIMQGNKTQHFKNLQKYTGVDYQDMVFFDDADAGRYGNCEPVAALGVLSVHTPRGLTPELFKLALETYALRKRQNIQGGFVLRHSQKSWTPSYVPSNTDWIAAKVIHWQQEKGFGFVQLCETAATATIGKNTVAKTKRSEKSSKADVFLHASVVHNDLGSDNITEGLLLQVKVATDNTGRSRCVSTKPHSNQPSNAAPPDAHASQLKNQTSLESLETHLAFSMGMPFAALLAHGYKSIESRNNPMFHRTAGQRVLLHVGMKTFDDRDDHVSIMRRHGASDKDIQTLTCLPTGFTRGQIVAVLTLGETTDLEESEQVWGWEGTERAVVAYKKSMGKYHTRILSVQWLNQGVTAKGRPGLFEVKVPKGVVPPPINYD